MPKVSRVLHGCLMSTSVARASELLDRTAVHPPRTNSHLSLWRVVWVLWIRVLLVLA